MALTDSIALMGSQYAYNGRGPFDAKMLVNSFNDLINPDTWKNAAGDDLAYNGMIVAVWKETSDSGKNGIYFLHDGNRNNKNLDVSKPENWHKLADSTALAEFITNNTLETALADYAKAVDVYTKGAVYTKEEVDALLADIEGGSSDSTITIEVATSEKLGGIKSGTGDNVVSVSADGIASIESVNTSTLTQTDGDFIILCGGSATKNI